MLHWLHLTGQPLIPQGSLMCPGFNPTTLTRMSSQLTSCRPVEFGHLRAVRCGIVHEVLVAAGHGNDIKSSVNDMLTLSPLLC